MIVTKEITDSFKQIDKATEGLQLKFQNLGITKDVDMEVNLVEISQETSMEVNNECRQEDYNKVAFPKEKENLMDFLHRCQRKKSEVMLCLRCSAMFEKQAAHNLEGVRRGKDQGFPRSPKDQHGFEPRRAFDPRRYFDPSRTLVRLDETK